MTWRIAPPLLPGAMVVRYMRSALHGYRLLIARVLSHSQHSAGGGAGGRATVRYAAAVASLYSRTRCRWAWQWRAVRRWCKRGTAVTAVLMLIGTLRWELTELVTVGLSALLVMYYVVKV